MSAAISPGSMLDLVTIEVPCTVPWESMAGDDRVRFCSQCQLHVYNISELSRIEAESLITSNHGKRLCGRIFRRPDGVVLTRDCFSVRRAARRSAAVMFTIIAGFVLSIMGWTTWAAVLPKDRSARFRPEDHEPFRTILNWLDPPKYYVPGELIITPTIATQPWTADDARNEVTETESTETDAAGD